MSNDLLIQIPLGIQTKNEAKIKEMAEILDTLNDYIPVKHMSDITGVQQIP